jgi:DNA-binding XRE family transcriptional regulator
MATIELAEGLANLLSASPSYLAFGDEDTPLPLPARRPRSAGMPARLRRARRRCGLSRELLGAVAGLSAAHIRQIEAGQIAAGLDLIETLASALDVPPCWLAYGELNWVTGLPSSVNELTKRCR